MMRKTKPILITDLFSPTLDTLIELLASLGPEDWEQPTVCGNWKVKDVALHLLAIDISNISRKRDGFSLTPKKPIRNNQDLLEFINELNQSWISAGQRISTALLVDLLRFVGQQVTAYFETIDPFSLGEPVSWAGPEPAPLWLDLAREYTERWHHQQHIRDAVRKPGLKEARFFAPVLDAFVRAMPYTYQDVTAPEGTCVCLIISGDAGGQWTIRQEEKAWVLYTGAEEPLVAKVTINQEDAWRLFTKGIDPNQVRARSSIAGSEDFGARIFQMVSIIA
ncbi:MAG: maleylpyruvate isomerase family mycothiol-dependent enzyme [Anaerolineales bacterium]